MTAFGGALADPTKIMGSRIGAYLVDTTLMLVVLFAYFGLIGINHWTHYEAPGRAEQVCNQINAESSQTTQAQSPARVVCFPLGDTVYVASNSQLASTQTELWVVWAILSLFNLVVLPAATGASLGKRLFGLRVVDAAGQRAGFFRNLVRTIVLFVDQFCCGIVGLVVCRNSAGHRRVGDMVAGTYVVHRSAYGKLLSIPGHLVVRRHTEFGGWGPAPAVEEPTLGQGGGVAAPVWDPNRNAYVRYDQGSGVWFQWDEGTQAWVPART